MPQRRRLRPTTVIACLALFFAVAGGSAIALKGRNSVDSGDIKKGQVKTSDLANNAVTTKKIKNGQVKKADLGPSEAFHVVGDNGEPQFSRGGEGDCVWASANVEAEALGRAAFFKDNLGIVHLRGLVFSTDVPAAGDGACTLTGNPEGLEDSLIFTLPAGYAPSQMEQFGTSNTNGPEFVFVGPVGGANLAPGITIPQGAVMVNFGGEEAVALGGMTFRAATPSDGLSRRASARRSQGPPPAHGLLPLP
jgi:hypothetical protein